MDDTQRERTPPRRAPTQTDVSPAATIIDISSDEEPTKDATAVVEHTNRRTTLLSPHTFWERRIPNYLVEYGKALADSRIHWRLNVDLSSADSLESQTQYCNGFIANRLQAGYVHGFKVGITFQPYNRWCGARMHGAYLKLNYKHLYILSIHEDASFTMSLEVQVLKHWRRFDRRSFLLKENDQPLGHPLCLNRNPGGENGAHGVAPFCLYLAVK